jgi:FkbM family methyltransferase
VRAALLTALRDAQAASADPAKFCEAVRWPLVEHLLRDVPELEVTLASGARIGISPRASRIEKHLLLAAEEAPHHVWEPQTTSLLGLLARDTADVIVGGAYIGDQVVPLADELRRRAAAAVIHAFEPAPWAFGHLVRNVERNGFDNVRCHRIGLWSEPAAGMRLVGEPALGAVTSQASSDGDVVEVTTIDAHCAAHGIAEVGLVMLDLEGGEEAALLGASSLLARPAGQAPAVVFEVHREHVDWSDGLDRTPIVTGLLALGYTVVAVRDLHGNRDMLGRPIEVVPVDDVYLGGPPHGFNVLAVKDAALLDRPELEVVPGVSPKLLPHGDPALHHPRGGF